MYNWRKLTPEQRIEILEYRKNQRLPYHSPPHRAGRWTDKYLVSAACYEHKPIIGTSVRRMTDFEASVLAIASLHGTVHAWAVLPNHYHLLVTTPEVEALLK